MVVLAQKLVILSILVIQAIVILVILCDRNLPYFKYKSYSFPAPQDDVKEQVFPRAGRGGPGHTNPFPVTTYSGAPAEAPEKSRR